MKRVVPICSACGCVGLRLEELQVDFEEDEVWLLGTCPKCKHFGRVSFRTIVYTAKGGEECQSEST